MTAVVIFHAVADHIKKTKNKGFLIFLYYLCTLNNRPAIILNKEKV